MLESISFVKSELNKLGISTATPGLVGDARLHELQKRLNSNGIHDDNHNIKSKSTTEYNELSIDEIKSRLIAANEVSIKNFFLYY
jgi:hypothetical protein